MPKILTPSLKCRERGLAESHAQDDRERGIHGGCAVVMAGTSAIGD